MTTSNASNATRQTTYRFGVPKRFTHSFKKHSYENRVSRYHFYTFNNQDRAVLNRAEGIINRFAVDEIEEALASANLMGQLRNYIHNDQVIPAIHVWQRNGERFFEQQKKHIFYGQVCPGPQIGHSGLVAEAEVTYNTDGEWEHGYWENRLDKFDQTIRLETSSLEYKFNMLLQTARPFNSNYDNLVLSVKKNPLGVTKASYRASEAAGEQMIDQKIMDKICDNFQAGLSISQRLVSDKQNRLACAVAQFGFTPTAAKSVLYPSF